MCTVIVGRDVVEPGTAWLAANRDEDPARPTDAPRVLHESPRVVGGRDRVAGGTWLAIREGHAAIAMLNRRPDRNAAASARGGAGSPAPPAPSADAPLRSRGLLALEAATAAANGRDEDLANAVLDHVRRALARARYAPFTLVFLAADQGWALAHDAGDDPRVQAIGPGWHVVTHADLDDPSEPRTAWLLEGLGSWSPRSSDEVERGLIERLKLHGGPHAPAVCIHEGRMVTVSSTLVHFARGGVRYLHAEGRPCEHPFVDRTDLAVQERPARATSDPRGAPQGGPA